MSEEIKSHSDYEKKLLLALKQANLELKNEKDRKNEPIAIIGASCRFPGGANSLDEYWDLLVNGKDAISEVPKDRWDLEEYYDPDPYEPGKLYCKWGGFLKDFNVAEFDAKFFSISNVEADMMDPQQRVILELCWEALENAGIDPLTLNKTSTSVFVAECNYDYGVLVTKDLKRVSSYTNSGISGSVTAGRISFILGLQGPCMTIDTACSSSLVAIHQACKSLRDHESNLAIVCGINLILSPDTTIGFCKSMMLADDGKCKSFDESANGYVRGEGGGVIIIKRLSDAKKDNDNILAVIKGSAINQDGASGGLTVPNGPAQEAVIKKALINADVKPSEINFVETHGTGTPLGDPIEIHALENVLKEGRTKSQDLVIGSVKTNIGHLESAAGMAGIIKIILSLKNQVIPKHLNFNQLNHNINLDGNINIIIPTKNMPWKSGVKKRIAGLSSFAFQGTNAHLIIEEAPALDETKKNLIESYVKENILAISTKNLEALKALVKDYNALLNKNKNKKDFFSDVAYSSNISRSKFNHRLTVLAHDASEASVKLRDWLEHGKSDNVYYAHVLNDFENKIGFLFTGYAKYYEHIAKNLYQTQLVFKSELELCSAILGKYLDKSLFSLLWGDDHVLLENPKYSAPVFFSLEYSLYKLWRSLNVNPDIIVGHGTGEYVAATVAKIFSLEDGLMLSCNYYKLIQVNDGDETNELIKLIEGVKVNKPVVQVFSTFLDDKLFADKHDKAQYWLMRAKSLPSLNNIYDIINSNDINICIDLSVKQVSNDPINEQTKTKNKILWINTLIYGVDDWHLLLNNVSHLYLAGINIHWKNFYGEYHGNKLEIPKYPFQRNKYWFDSHE